MKDIKLSGGLRLEEYSFFLIDKSTEVLQVDNIESVDLNKYLIIKGNILTVKED